jgi:AraC-like DNA-binding protein
VLLRPGVLGWLFDLPAAAWVNRRGPAAEVIGTAAAEMLRSQLCRAHSTAAQVWIIEQQLQCWVQRAQARRAWQPPPRAPAANASVGEWANAATSSARQLQRRVSDSLGLPPKALLRIERLHESLGRLTRGEALATVAAQCGFSHAAHMVREFRALTGLSPAGVRRDLAHHEGLPWRIASAGL